MLDKHYSMALADLLKRERWVFDAEEMCQVLDHISISENEQITVTLLGGTQVEL